MQIDEARRVLYMLDNGGNIVGNTPLYEMYQRNANAYGEAKKHYADAYAEAMRDPMKLQNWPLTGRQFQQTIDDAYSNWKAADVARVEVALTTLGMVPAEK